MTPRTFAGADYEVAVMLAPPIATIQVPASHTLMMNNREVRALVRQVLIRAAA